MDLRKIYEENYIPDTETEIPEFGFHIIVSGENLFYGNNYKTRCFRSIRRHIAVKGYKVYAVNCVDDSLHMIVGNCTYNDITTALRIFSASYTVFFNGTTEKRIAHKTGLRLIKSVRDFKQIFYNITIINKKDFADCITNRWNSFCYLLTDNWEYGDIISKEEIFQAFECEQRPYKLARAVFDRAHIDCDEHPVYIEKFYSRKEPVFAKEKTTYVINKILADYYGYPIDFFYLFPEMRANMITHAMDNEDLFSSMIYTLAKNGNTFRKSAEALNCNYSKLYNLYKKYIEENNLPNIHKKEEDANDVKS